MMVEEGFTENEIANTMNKVEWKTYGLKSKDVYKRQMRYTEKKYFPYIWDRWKMFVAVRK